MNGDGGSGHTPNRRLVTLPRSDSTPRVRFRRAVTLHTDRSGQLDRDEVAAVSALAGDDVVVTLVGPVGFDPGGAQLLGRVLAGARTIEVVGDGPGVEVLARDLTRGACGEWVA